MKCRENERCHRKRNRLIRAFLKLLVHSFAFLLPLLNVPSGLQSVFYSSVSAAAGECPSVGLHVGIPELIWDRTHHCLLLCARRSDQSTSPVSIVNLNAHPLHGSLTLSDMDSDSDSCPIQK